MLWQDVCLTASPYTSPLYQRISFTECSIPGALGYPPLLYLAISRELDGMCSSWDTNLHSHGVPVHARPGFSH